MLDLVFNSMHGQGKAWREEAARRRRISGTDPVADTLEHCADELDESVLQLEQDSEWLTPEQFGAAQHPPVSAQTVRNWIRRGKLRAEESAHGFRIARTAQRQKRQRERK